MTLSLLNPFLGRTLFRTRAFQFARTVTPALLTRSFLTSSILAEEKAEKAAKKPRAPAAKKRGRPVKKASKPAKPKVKVFKRDLKVPTLKWPLTPWMDFCGKYLAEHKKSGEMMIPYVKEANVAWRALSPEEQERYGSTSEEWAEARETAKQWRARPEYKRAAKKFKIKRKVVGPLNSYAQFVKSSYDSSSGQSFREQTTILAQKWRSFTVLEKDHWKQRAIEEFEKSKPSEAE